MDKRTVIAENGKTAVLGGPSLNSRWDVQFDEFGVTYTPKPAETTATKYRYGEDTSIKKLHDYIDATYKQHYATPNEDIQAIDAWYTLGNCDTSCRDTIIKYAWRLGRKDIEEKEVMKIMHYCLFLLEVYRRRDKNANNSSGT